MESEAHAGHARSRLYGFVSRFFLPPTDELAQGLTTGELIDQVRSASDALGDAGVTAALERMVQAYAEHRPADHDALNTQFERTYGQAAGRDRPIYELQYGGSSDFGTPQELADLNGYYQAFSLDQIAPDRCDHVAVETEFASYLCYLEAWAAANGHAEQREVAGTALRGFLVQHLSGFTAAFWLRVSTTAAPGIYLEAAGLLSALVDEHCLKLAVARRERRYVEPQPEEDTLEPMTEGAP